MIVVLLKKGGNKLVRGAYWPLSILNLDCRILGKIIANSLLPYVPKLIHPDQCGFIPGRSTSANIRRLYHVMDGFPRMLNHAAAVSLDMGKAFNSLSWPYLFKVLQHMGLGHGLIT